MLLFCKVAVHLWIRCLSPLGGRVKLHLCPDSEGFWLCRSCSWQEGPSVAVLVTAEPDQADNECALLFEQEVGGVEVKKLQSALMNHIKNDLEKIFWSPTQLRRMT